MRFRRGSVVIQQEIIRHQEIIVEIAATESERDEFQQVDSFRDWIRIQCREFASQPSVVLALYNVDSFAGCRVAPTQIETEFRPRFRRLSDGRILRLAYVSAQTTRADVNGHRYTPKDI